MNFHGYEQALSLRVIGAKVNELLVVYETESHLEQPSLPSQECTMNVRILWKVRNEMKVNT